MQADGGPCTAVPNFQQHLLGDERVLQQYSKQYSVPLLGGAIAGAAAPECTTDKQS